MPPCRISRRSFLTGCAGLTGIASLTGAHPGPIRIAQIGTAHSHAKGKMAAIRSMPALFEVVGIAEPDAVLRASAESDPAYLGLRWLTPQALLSDPEVEVIVIETSLQEAPRRAVAAIEAGKSIHLDKPGAALHADFRRLRIEASRRGLTVQMGYMLRYNPGIQLLGRAVREGWLGDITEIDAAMGKLADAEAREVLLGYPGNGMFELACHLVDVIVMLVGQPQRVHAFQRSTVHSGAILKDNQLAVLEYPGVVATLRCNHADPSGQAHRRIQVVGTRGSLLLQPLESGQGLLRLSESHGEFSRGETVISLPRSGGRYDGEFRDLASVIRGGKRLGWSVDHDIAVHATALRCAGVDPDAPR